MPIHDASIKKKGLPVSIQLQVGQGCHCEGREGNSAFIGILESNVGFDYAKLLEDCHCEGKA